MLHTERDETIRMRVRKRTEEDAIDDAEDRGGCADAERERSNDGEGEERVAAEATQCVARILRDGGE